MEKKDNVKIIQISAISHTDCPDTIYGLGNDGNLYVWVDRITNGRVINWILNT